MQEQAFFKGNFLGWFLPTLFYDQIIRFFKKFAYKILSLQSNQQTTVIKITLKQKNIMKGKIIIFLKECKENIFLNIFLSTPWAIALGFLVYFQSLNLPISIICGFIFFNSRLSSEISRDKIAAQHKEIELLKAELNKSNLNF